MSKQVVVTLVGPLPVDGSPVPLIAPEGFPVWAGCLPSFTTTRDMTGARITLPAIVVMWEEEPAPPPPPVMPAFAPL